MSFVVISLYIMLSFVFFSAVAEILWRVVTLQQIPFFICLFLILPVGQMLMLYSFSFDGWSAFWLAGLAMSLTAHILLLLYTTLQEKKTAAQEKLRETQHKASLEKSHYDAAIIRQDELDNIRSQFKEKLKIVAEHIRSGEEVMAHNSIFELADRIALTSEKRYCAVPVINAVLTEKEKTCVEAGIVLSVNLNLPDTFVIEPMHLCSIFSNLMDNAIEACRKTSGNRNIRLSSKINGDYLFIKIVNPSLEPPLKSLQGRGYGSRILSDLALRYGGSYKGEYNSGEFVAVVALLAQFDGGDCNT